MAQAPTKSEYLRARAARTLESIEAQVRIHDDSQDPSGISTNTIKRIRGNNAFQIYMQAEGLLQIFNLGYGIVVDSGPQADGSQAWHEKLFESFRAETHPLHEYFTRQYAKPFTLAKGFRNEWKTEWNKFYDDPSPVSQQMEVTLVAFEKWMKIMVMTFRAIISKELPKWKD